MAGILYSMYEVRENFEIFFNVACLAANQKFFQAQQGYLRNMKVYLTNDDCNFWINFNAYFKNDFNKRKSSNSRNKNSPTTKVKLITRSLSLS